jgi:leucyl-tRNA synthetase
MNLNNNDKTIAKGQIKLFVKETGKEITKKNLVIKNSPHITALSFGGDIVSNTIKIAVQVNGKMRGSVEVKINAEQDAITKIATQLESVKNQLCDKQITKIIFVPNKIINFIINTY